MTPRCQSGVRGGRAFTLLEVVMAGAIGAVIVLACVGIFSAMDRSDVLLAARAEQSGDLQRARLVMQRALLKLVFSNEPRPTPDDPSNPNRRRRDASNPDAPPPPPRFILEASPAARSAAMSTARGVSITPQRLEVVVTESPVPTAPRDDVADLLSGRVVTRRRAADADKPSMFDRSSNAKGATGSAADRSAKTGSSGPSLGAAASSTKLFDLTPSQPSGSLSGKGAGSNIGIDPRAAAASFTPPAPDADSGATEDDDAESTVRCVRGSFELRPQELSARQRAVLERRGLADVTSWELWWVPLPPRVPDDATVPQSFLRRPLDEPTLIAQNLRSVQWRVFDDRKKKTALTATWSVELPAYAEAEIETTAGLKADWLFEVDSFTGAEVPKPRAAQGTRDAARAVPILKDLPLVGVKPGAGGKQ